MAFLAAMNASNTKAGVNGEEVLTEAGVGDVRVSLFTMLNRTLEASYIASSIASAPAAFLEDFLVMAMQTRDIRGGKGERDLFYAMFEALYLRVPAAVEVLVPLVPEYGCWRDLWKLHARLPALRPAIHAKVRAQWTEDSVRLEKSLLAKWLPREGSKTYPGLATTLAKVLFPTIPYMGRMIHYRKTVAAANRALNTVEVKMCEGSWASIEPAHVPGRCFKIRSAALHNQSLEKRTGCHGTQKRRSTGAERVGSEDRRQCAAATRAFLERALAGKATIKGAHVVQPHELVQDVLWSHCEWSESVAEAQWLAIRDATLKAGGFGKAVAMCDFSGSMAGTPMLVSLALGILISETNHVAFRDHILTFDEDPQWHSFVDQTSLKSKVKTVHDKCGHGLSTDFYKACMLILDRMKAAAVPTGEEPEDLIVLTDMGWDAAHGPHAPQSGYSTNRKPWKGQVAKIRAAFVAEGYNAPRIVIWNLRAAYKDFHAAAEDEGVVMISGWSPNVLTALQDGVQMRTPLEALRATLDDPRYNAVRKALHSLKIAP